MAVPVVPLVDLPLAQLHCRYLYHLLLSAEIVVVVGGVVDVVHPLRHRSYHGVAKLLYQL
jgi:hypothetical protein